MTTRGVYVPPNARPPIGERPLYLLITGPNKQSIQMAEKMIHDVIRTGDGATPPMQPMFPMGPMGPMQMNPMQMNPMNSMSGMYMPNPLHMPMIPLPSVLTDQAYVPFAHGVDPSFGLSDRLLGPQVLTF